VKSKYVLAALWQWKRDHAVEHRLERRALKVASEDIDRRLAEGNKFREQIKDERANLVEKDWYESKHEELSNRITSLEEWRWKIIGIVVACSVFGGIVGWVISLFIRR
jgi:hypothetical protein